MEIWQIVGLLFLVFVTFTVLGIITVILASTPSEQCGYQPKERRN
jgi:hypothetical protein